jgi:hypothetical protein
MDYQQHKFKFLYKDYITFLQAQIVTLSPFLYPQLQTQHYRIQFKTHKNNICQTAEHNNNNHRSQHQSSSLDRIKNVNVNWSTNSVIREQIKLIEGHSNRIHRHKRKDSYFVQFFLDLGRIWYCWNFFF